MRFNFGEFVLDTAARELRRGQAAVHLSPKGFELLQMLLEHRPAAVSKSDLHARLWPDTFVTDTSLATLVGELRAALEDDARRPRFVRTVHSFGYAFSETAVAAESDPGARYWIEYDGRRILLGDGESIIGRAAASTVVVDLAEVSRRHALVRVTAEGATLEDLNSRNGTFVAETRITAPHALRDGDRITIGPATLSFHASAGDATTKAILIPRS